MNNERITPKRSGIFAVLLMAAIIGSFLQTALSTAIPTIMGNFDISASDAQWLTSAYSLAMGVVVPLTAYLLKRYKTKPLLIISLAVFTLGAFLNGVTDQFSFMLIGRIMQAVGSGITVAMTQVVVLTIFPKEKRGTVMGLYGFAVGVAPMFASALAGLIIEWFGWRMIFFSAFGLGVISLLAAFMVMENVLETEIARFDFASLVLSAVGFIALTLGISNFADTSFFSISVGLTLLIGIGALVMFVLRQNRLEKPFIQLKVLKNRNLCTAIIISMLLYGILIAGAMITPMYTQMVRGLSPAVFGLFMLPGSLVMTFLNPFAGKMYDRWGIRRPAMLGAICMLVSCASLCFADSQTSIAYLVTVFIIRNMAVGFVMMPIVTWGLAQVPPQMTSDGTAILTTLRTMAGAFGSVLFALVLTLATNASAQGIGIAINEIGARAAFIGMTVVAAIQFIVTVLYVKDEKAG